MQFYTHPVGCKVICLRFGFRMGVLVNVNLLVSLPWYINFSSFFFGFSFFLISEREMPPEIHFALASRLQQTALEVTPPIHQWLILQWDKLQLQCLECSRWQKPFLYSEICCKRWKQGYSDQNVQQKQNWFMSAAVKGPETCLRGKRLHCLVICHKIPTPEFLMIMT